MPVVFKKTGIRHGSRYWQKISSGKQKAFKEGFRQPLFAAHVETHCYASLRRSKNIPENHMTFFCPVCWKEIRQVDTICPCCNAHLPEYENKHFEEKLINALRHPERETVQRAVYLLGKRKSVKAAKPLLDLFKQTNNTFLQIAIL